MKTQHPIADARLFEGRSLPKMLVAEDFGPSLLFCKRVRFLIVKKHVLKKPSKWIGVLFPTFATKIGMKFYINVRLEVNMLRNCLFSHSFCFLAR